MTRILFFLFCLVAMLAAMTAVLIRIELAASGVSPLFQTPDGLPDGDKFGGVAVAHGLFSYLAVMLLGTVMIAAAREGGARLAGFFTVIGVLICAVTALVILASFVPYAPLAENLLQQDQSGVGWVLYPPLSTQGPETLLDYLIGDLTPDALVYVDLSRYLLLPAAGLLYLGAAMMVSSERGFGWFGIFMAVLIIVVAVLSAPTLHNTGVAYATSGFLAVALPILACASIRLVDGGPDWLLILTIGLVASVTAQLVMIVNPATMFATGTMADIAALYTFPLGLAWFALPAVMLFRHPTTLPEPVIWTMAGALALALLAWIAPLVMVGLSGQPMRYVDFPEAYGVLNMIASVGVGVFLTLTLAIVTLLARRRA